MIVTIHPRVRKARRDLADIFLRAAEIVATPGFHYGCCWALDAVQPYDFQSKWYESAAHHAFCELFPWNEIDHFSEYEHWRGEIFPDGSRNDYPEDAREARVLALLFCAEAARLGEIG